jgi:hypothetical protein
MNYCGYMYPERLADLYLSLAGKICLKLYEQMSS